MIGAQSYIFGGQRSLIWIQYLIFIVLDAIRHSKIRNTDQFELIGNWHEKCIKDYVKQIQEELDSRHSSLNEEDFIRMISKHYYDF